MRVDISVVVQNTTLHAALQELSRASRRYAQKSSEPTCGIMRIPFIVNALYKISLSWSCFLTEVNEKACYNLSEMGDILVYTQFQDKLRQWDQHVCIWYKKEA
jgi:hypothetical protein